MATPATAIAPGNLLDASLAGYRGPVINNNIRETPPSQVEPEAFNAASKAFFEEELEGMVLFDTPPGDMQKARELLDLPADFPTYTCKVQEGFLTCTTCGRTPNFYDLCKTATNVHTTNFLRSVLMGEQGPILNTNSTQRMECAGCGSEMPREATRFVCIRPAVAGPVQRYSYKSAYTYKK